MEAIPKGMLLTGFGMMLYDGDPEALALEIAKLPAPLRPILPCSPGTHSGSTPAASTAPRPRARTSLNAPSLGSVTLRDLADPTGVPTRCHT